MWKHQVEILLKENTLKNLKTLGSFKACAGIKGDAETVRKMSINNFGCMTGKAIIPARPWVEAATGTDKEFRRAYSTFIKWAISKNVGNLNKLAPHTALLNIAKTMAANQREYIDRYEAVENAESTIQRKKGDQPLVWTGKGRAAIKGWIE